MAKLEFQDGPSLLFEEAPNDLIVFKSGSGLRIQLPMQVALRWAGEPQPRPMLSHIRCTVSIMDQARQATELGVATDDSIYSANRGTHPLTGRLEWRLDLGTLAILERIRDGKQPRFEFRVTAIMCDLVRITGGNDWREVQTGAQQTLGMAELTYSLEVWNRMLQRAGVSQNVLVEIPVQAASPAG